jgi:hypothetical protein
VLYLVSALVGLAIGALLVAVWTARLRDQARADRVEAEDARRQAAEHSRQSSANAESLKQEAERLKAEAAALQSEKERFARVGIGIEDLRRENIAIKRDLANVGVTAAKLRLDRDLQAARQKWLDGRASELAQKYLSEVEKQVSQQISANNFAACKQRLSKAIEWCREIGFDVPAAKEEELLSQLKADFEAEVRREVEREEQARIRAQIREEERLARDLERERQAAERERLAIQEALNRALADTKTAHTAEIEQLRARLAQAEARVQERMISQAELTKAGHIYVISNIGSFGEMVFKIGMTRRLDPIERIDELSDASVPFPFDVHMMISCKDAPALENLLHRQFHRFRVNKVNPRKEFFRLDLAEIRAFVEANHGKVEFVAEPNAAEYRQSITMSDQDSEYIERVFERATSAESPRIED